MTRTRTHRRALKRAAKRAHSDPRRRHGHDDPALRSARRTIAASASRTTARPEGQQRPPRADPAGRSSREIHDAYLAAGADIIETNTFNAHRDRPGRVRHARTLVRDMNVDAAQARARAPPTPGPRRRRTSRASSPAPSARRTGRRRSRPTSTIPALATSTSTSCVAAYNEQVRGAARRRRRHHPDRDDLRHAERQGRDHRGRSSCSTRAARELPIMISGTITDRSGRTLSGQTVGSVLELGAPRAAVLDRPQLRARRRADAAVHRRARARRRHADLAYPNAGLPNAMGEYDESPRRDGRAARASGPRTGSSTSSAAAAARRRITSRAIAEPSPRS